MTSNKRLLLVVLGIVFLLIIVQLYSLGTYSPGSGRHSSSSTSTFGQDSDLRDDHYRKEYGTPWAPSDATDYDRMYAAIDKQPRPKAAMVILTRNEELDELIQTLQVFEKRFNHRYDYPYVLLNDVAFTVDFKHRLSKALPANRLIEYGQIPKEQWSYPAWIDQDKARKGREAMSKENIPYGGSESYRHMCRFQSGFFFRHPLLDKYKYYWRVEPSTRLLCDVRYDPFRRMAARDAKYGFTISIYEYDKTVPTLYKETLAFAHQWRSRDSSYNPELLNFFDNGKGGYNMCHYWSNFEIGSVEWLRSEAYTSYFDHLDKAGGFFYERWGDAPVHSLAVGLFLNRTEVIYFEDIGYYHNPMRNCPLSVSTYHLNNCECDRLDAVRFNEGSCLSKWMDYQPRPYF